MASSSAVTPATLDGASHRPDVMAVAGVRVACAATTTSRPRHHRLSAWLSSAGRPGLAVKRRLRAAWKLPAHKAAIERLKALAGELAQSHPGAAASLREGLGETVTLQRLGVHQQLRKTLSSTNPIESMIAICRATSRNVKRWQNGDMCLRWTAAGMLEARRQFRKIIGYPHLAALALAVEADVAARRAVTSPTTISPTDPVWVGFMVPPLVVVVEADVAASSIATCSARRRRNASRQK